MIDKVAAREYSRDIVMHADKFNQRTGQYLFNSFPVEVANVVTGSMFDPFHKDMSQFQIEEWLLNHIVFNENGSIVAVFNENTILWERKY